MSVQFNHQSYRLTHKTWALHIGFFVFLIALDQVTKLSALNLGLLLEHQYVFIKIHLAENHNLIGGSFSKLPPQIKTVYVSTFGMFQLFLYFALQFLVPIRSKVFRLGLTVTFAGFLGNVLDRIFRGYVVDFITLAMPQFPTWNVADMFQWMGLAMTLFPAYQYLKMILPDKNNRGQHWINPGFQGRFLMSLLAIQWGICLVSWVFAVTYLKAVMNQNASFGELDEIIKSFSLSYFVVSLIFSIVVIIFSSIYSHRISGPIYAITRYWQDLQAGKNYPFKLRKGDEFPELETLAQQLSEKTKIE